MHGWKKQKFQKKKPTFKIISTSNTKSEIIRELNNSKKLEKPSNLKIYKPSNLKNALKIRIYHSSNAKNYQLVLHKKKYRYWSLLIALVLSRPSTSKIRPELHSVNPSSNKHFKKIRPKHSLQKLKKSSSPRKMLKKCRYLVNWRTFYFWIFCLF